MKEKILITGGTGLVGKKLTKMLLSIGYEIGILTRGSSKKSGDINYYHWDIADKKIDDDALEGTSYIINLVGAGVSDKAWSEDRKKVILESRTQSADFLLEEIKQRSTPLKGFISASAIGIYGNFEGADLKTESSSFGNDFLANVTVEWEKAANQFQQLGIRTTLLRIGIVLAKDGGALDKIAKPIKLMVGAPLGSGDQYMSWVHIEDLCKMFIWAIQNEDVSGPYNAVNPNPVTNAEFTKQTASALKKPLWLPNVPSFVLKLMLGEMASIVLGGSRISPQKIIDAGFTHQYNELEEALQDLLSK